jgi:hypothetical protein
MTADWLHFIRALGDKSCNNEQDSRRAGEETHVGAGSYLPLVAAANGKFAVAGRAKTSERVLRVRVKVNGCRSSSLSTCTSRQHAVLERHWHASPDAP